MGEIERGREGGRGREKRKEKGRKSKEKKGRDKEERGREMEGKRRGEREKGREPRGRAIYRGQEKGETGKKDGDKSKARD